MINRPIGTKIAYLRTVSSLMYGFSHCVDVEPTCSQPFIELFNK